MWFFSKAQNIQFMIYRKSHGCRLKLIKSHMRRLENYWVSGHIVTEVSVLTSYACCQHGFEFMEYRYWIQFFTTIHVLLNYYKKETKYTTFLPMYYIFWCAEWAWSLNKPGCQACSVHNLYDGCNRQTDSRSFCEISKNRNKCTSAFSVGVGS